MKSLLAGAGPLYINALAFVSVGIVGVFAILAAEVLLLLMGFEGGR